MFLKNSEMMEGQDLIDDLTDQVTFDYNKDTLSHICENWVNDLYAILGKYRQAKVGGLTWEDSDDF